MVKPISSVGRNGVHDYLLIRASAIVMTLYVIFLMSFFVSESSINYHNWYAFFGNTFTKVFTMLALVSVLVHAWIGLWQVLTDYVKVAALRALLQLAVIVALVAYVFSGLFILWGV